MANLNRFACHETDTLASDLVRLLQPASPGTFVAGSAAGPVRATAGFPGIILLYDGRPCAAVGYHRESEGTVVVSEPVVLMDAADQVCHALCDRLLKHVKHRTAADGAQRLHFLRQKKSSADPKFEELLQAQRFVHATDIIQWELSVAADDQCLPLGRYEFHRYDFPVTNTVSAGELHCALEEILECSEDLTSRPQPTASELLTRWQHDSATVYLCRTEGRIAGVISLGMCAMTSAAIVPDILPAEASLCIEYIGVLPEYRRRGIARLMIGQIPVLRGSYGDEPTARCSTEAFKVTAYSDATNGPATSLYERAGFVRTARMQLWCCDLHQEVSG